MKRNTSGIFKRYLMTIFIETNKYIAKASAGTINTQFQKNPIMTDTVNPNENKGGIRCLSRKAF